MFIFNKFKNLLFKILRLNQTTDEDLVPPFRHLISKAHLDGLSDQAEKNIHELSDIVLKGLKPPAGAYAFFNHNSHMLSRLIDCRKILNRLFNQRYILTELSIRLFQIEPKNWPAGVPYPKNVQKIMRQENEINGYMQLDLESFYIFGGILLDQWSIQVIAVGNLPLKKRHPFVELVDFLEKTPNNVLDPVWTVLKKEMLWLYYQLRFYRNRFIVHANRPWQRGTTRSVYGEDYNLHTPTPPGWIDDKAIDKEIKKLIYLAPENIQKARDDYWEKARPGALLERIFDNIGNIKNKGDREKVAELYGEKGGSTPSFQIVAKNLLHFVAEGTTLLCSIAKDNLSNINLGKPFMSSKEMWKAREKKL